VGRVESLNGRRSRPERKKQNSCIACSRRGGEKGTCKDASRCSETVQGSDCNEVERGRKMQKSASWYLIRSCVGG